jgi:hypothetical protein
MQLSKWLGRQSARLKQGIIYFNIIVSSITVVSLVKIAFNLDVIGMTILVPVLLISSWFIGWILDKKDVVTEDLRKTTEMNARYLSMADEKANRFTIMNTAVLLSIFGNLEVSEAKQMLESEYQKYRQSWLPDDEKEET